MLTCALKSQQGKLRALLFYFSGKNKGSVEIDLTRYEKIETTDLKSKVQRIIDGYLDQEDLSQGIIDAFNTDKAAGILMESSSPQKTDKLQNLKEEARKERSGERNKKIDKKIENASEIDLRRMQIEDEIERIRKAANSQ